jgi:hypothetical protein
VLSQKDKRPATPRVDARQNKYDSSRIHLAVFNWQKQPAVEWKPGGLLKRGQRYELLDPRDFYGKPLTQGTYDGRSIRIPVKGEFAAFVLRATDAETR